MAFETALRGEKGASAVSAPLLKPSKGAGALCVARRPTVAVLFARADSNYKLMPECEVYDEQRNALTYTGTLPVIAHPPCRSWGRLRHMAKPRIGERELALWAVGEVRRCGGVLEHPETSLLWNELELPAPRTRDAHGGFVVTVYQWWWDHKAQKATRLYVCGASIADLPPIPFKLGHATHVIAQSRQRQRLRLRPEVTKPEREHTPTRFCEWLIELAARCSPR